MGEKTAEEIVELYEMLGANSQQKSAKGRRVRVNEVQTNNEMATQLIELTRQVALLNSHTQPSNEIYGSCDVIGHRANICPHNLYELEQINLMNANQPRPPLIHSLTLITLGERVIQTSPREIILRLPCRMPSPT